MPARQVSTPELHLNPLISSLEMLVNGETPKFKDFVVIFQQCPIDADAVTLGSRAKSTERGLWSVIAENLLQHHCSDRHKSRCSQEQSEILK